MCQGTNEGDGVKGLGRITISFKCIISFVRRHIFQKTIENKYYYRLTKLQKFRNFS